jgi:hypothetical protein
MSAYLFFYNQNRLEDDKERKSSVFGVVTYIISVYGIVATFIVFAMTLWIPNLSAEKLETKSFKNKFGFLYDGLRFKDWSLAFYFFFFLRRIALCWIFLFIQEYNAIQILTLLYLNMIISIYIGNVRPNVNRAENRNQTINEMLISFLSYSFVIFTDFVPSPND